MVVDDLPVWSTRVSGDFPQTGGYLVPPPPGKISPLILGPSKRPPLKMTVLLSPNGPLPMCLKVSMSHSRWKRNCRDGRRRVYSGFVHFVFVNEDMGWAGSTVPGLIYIVILGRSKRFLPCPVKS